jgi:threonine aldolase
VRTVHADDGILQWNAVRQAIRLPSPHWAPTGLVEIENTHNMAGGTVYPLEVIREICANAHDMGIPVHMDGARIFNAACSLNRPVHELAAPADTVMFCLSKGLGAPVGSMLVGTAEAIERGRMYRKRLGGAMRQVGVIAAAGLIALEEMRHRLGEDHANASEFCGRLRARGVLMNEASNPREVRAVTHYDVTHAQCAEAAQIAAGVASEATAARA